MTYDLRTRRATKMRALRIIIGTTIGLLLTLCVGTFFSLARYSDSDQSGRISASSDFSREEISSLEKIAQSIPLSTRITPDAPKKWKLEPSSSPDKRETAIKTILRHQKKTVTIEPEGVTAILSEGISQKNDIKIHKRIVFLLPGEQLTIPVTSLEPSTKKLAIRCLGAPADRRDLPAKLTVADISAKTDDRDAIGSKQTIDISPRGLPAFVNLHRSSATIALSLEWTANQPGILVVDGEVQEIDSLPKQQFLASIDSIDSSLETLPKLGKAINSAQLGWSRFYPIWPSSTAANKNNMGIMNGMLPGDLGEFVEHDATRERIRSEFSKSIEEKFNKKGWRTLRINTQSTRCDSLCAPASALSHPLQLGRFDSLVTVERAEEFESVLEPLFAEKITFASRLFINLNLNFPQEQLAPRWKGAFSSQGSLFHWLAGTWFKGSLFRNSFLVAHAGEKRMQLDSILTALLKSMHLTRELPSVALVQRTNLQNKIERYGPDFNLPSGEAIVFNPPSTSVDLPIRSQHSLFALFDQPLNSPAKENLVVVQEDLREFFLFDSGWVVLPIGADSNFITSKIETKTAKPFAHIPLEELGKAFDAIETTRSRYRVQSLNVLIGNLQPNTRYSILIPNNSTVRECFATNREIQLLRRNEKTEDGPESRESGETRLDIAAAKAIPSAKISCVAEISTPNPLPINLRILENGQIVSPDSIAVGEFSLAGKLFSNPDGSGSLTLPTSGEFSPSAFSPQFDQKSQPKFSIWMERFSHIRGNREELQ